MHKPSRPHVPLFKRYPLLQRKIPWTSLADLPTPVERSTAMEQKHRRLTRTTTSSSRGSGGDRGCNICIYVKRDDQTASIYGGSKVRKLEHLLADAVLQQRQWVVAWGGAGSHQAVATALFGSKMDLKVALLLVPQKPITLEVANNVLVDLVHAAEVQLVPHSLNSGGIESRIADDARTASPPQSTASTSLTSPCVCQNITVSTPLPTSLTPPPPQSQPPLPPPPPLLPPPSPLVALLDVCSNMAANALAV